MSFETAPISKGQLWTGRVLSGLVIAFLLIDAVGKLIPIKPSIDSMPSLGFAADVGLVRTLGAILLVCTVLYIVPRTAAFGAVLLTGYLGGAVAVNLRAGFPLFTHVLFAVYVGILMWGGLFLRSRVVRATFLT